MEWTLALAAFWTTRVSAINQVYFIAALFLSGQMAPALTSSRAAAVSRPRSLPFRWTTSFPVELLLGRVELAGGAHGAGRAGGVDRRSVLFLLRLVWRAGVRVYSAVGA